MVKYILFIFISLACIDLSAQEASRDASDSVIVNDIIRNKILDKRDNSIITLFDSSGKMILIIKSNQKYNAYKQFYRGEKEKKRKVKLSKKDIDNIDKLFQNPNALYEFSDDNCSEMVHSFTKISVMIYNGEFFHGSFYTHCKQNENVKSVKELYFSLK